MRSKAAGMILIWLTLAGALVTASASAAPSGAAPTDGIWNGGLSFRVIELDGRLVVANASTNPGYPIPCGRRTYTVRIGRKLPVSPSGEFEFAGRAAGLDGHRVWIEGRFDDDDHASGTLRIGGGGCESPTSDWTAERADTPPHMTDAEERSARAGFLHCRRFSNCEFTGVTCSPRPSGRIRCLVAIKYIYSPGDGIRSTATFVWERRGGQLRLVSRTNW